MAKNIRGKYAYLNQLSTEQLEELLRADFESNSENDVDAIFHILEVIENREKEHPTGRLPDTNKAWNEFQQYYNIPNGKDMQLYPYEQGTNTATKDILITDQMPDATNSRKTHRGLMNILVASIAVIVFFSGMVIAQAMGIDVFGAIGQWTDDTFHFIAMDKVVTPHLDNDSDKTGNRKNLEYYTIIQEALRDYGIDADLAPSWYPSDVTISGPEIGSTDYNDIIYFSFSNGKKFFSVDIACYRSASDLNTSTFEKDGSPVEQYTNGARTFYIFSNEDTITATWSSELLVETIAGNLQIDELKAIIDSIGE